MSDLHLLDTPQVDELGRGLGRVWLPDNDDFKYMMAPLLTEVPVKTHRYYQTGDILNQLNTPHCVGYSWSQWLASAPVMQGGPQPQTIYCEAQTHDPWEGDCSNPRYDGSTVRAGAKALQARGLIGTYVWAFTADTVANWLLLDKGPVVVGTNWYRSMSFPDKRTGIVLVDEHSPLDGGHAYLCVGYNSKTRMFRFVNSWGESYGQSGRFWMHHDDLDLLLSKRGEACTATEIRLAA